MSSFHDTRPQDLGPERLKPDQGTRTLGPSVEATSWASDLCTGDATRGRILGWLAVGVREVSWALCSLPREHWTTSPAPHVSDWPALRHARHLLLGESHLVLPGVRQALGESGCAAALTSTLELERADAAWDPAEAAESAEAIIAGLGQTRFELLQRLESAPDEAWERPITASVVSEPRGAARPVQLDWLLLNARQHELEHLAAMWRIALNWDLSPPPPPRTPIPGVPLHPADRPEESH